MPKKRLPNFSRGFVVVAPHGSWIAEGSKPYLVKSRRYRMDNEPLLLIQKKMALAVVRLGPPDEITLKQFKARRGKHRVSEEERKRWWPRKRRFYYYPVVSVRRLRSPIPVDYPRGPQVFVLRKNVRIRRSATRRG